MLDNSPVVVVGAGLSGLVCAHELLRAGAPVVVIEADERPGGRVQTDVTRDGYRLDRGFQVLFAGYPALRRQIPLAALLPRYFSSALEIAAHGEVSLLAHPLLAPGGIARTLASRLATRGDALALTRTTLASLAFADRPLRSDGRTVRQALLDGGAGEGFLNDVVSPLFGGISFDRSLGSDAAFLGLVLRSMALARVFLPAFGVGQLAALLAARLPPGAIRYRTRAQSIALHDGNVCGIDTDEGEIETGCVVVAVDAPAAARLTGASLPQEHRSCTTVYFSSRRPVYRSKRLVLNAAQSLVNEVVQITNIAPEYAPSGHHLLAATALHLVPGTDDELAAGFLSDVRNWFPPARNETLEPVGVARVPYAQFRQPPGVYETLATSHTGTRGLYLAGEYLHSSSVQGAMRSGEWAAHAVLNAPR